MYLVKKYKHCHKTKLATHDTMTCHPNHNMSQKVYKFLGDDVMLIHNKYMKWREDLGAELCQSLVEFGQRHKEVYKITNVPKYRSFQYRLLQRGIVTNIHLKKWGLSETDLCSFCHLQKETLMHLFTSCEHVMEFCSPVAYYIESRYQISTGSIRNEDIIFNSVTRPIGAHM